jgi:glyoxylase-like metal-dependent hydrolase (beta-lactamase superfamily II)
MADFIRERGYATNDIVLTHGHGDHIYGAEPLKSGQVVNIEDRFGLL